MSPPSAADAPANAGAEKSSPPQRSSPPTEPAIDRVRIESATRELLLALGEDPDRPGLRETPRRIAESWRDFYAGDHTVVRPLPDQPPSGDDLVLVRSIEFVSVCEHHLLPFSGLVHVAYQPRDILLGLSDIPRLVRRASSRLHLQEGLTQQIADQLRAETNAEGVFVVVHARHGCVADRGIRQASVRAVTTAARGSLDNPSDRIGLMTVLTADSGTGATDTAVHASPRLHPS